MAEKILNTRIQLKYDTLANWNSSTFKLKAGELAIVTLGENVDGSRWPKDEALEKIQHPVLFKVGDGNHTFSQLPFASALAADVYAWAKASDVKLEGKTIKFVGTDKAIDIPYITEAEAITKINEALTTYSTTEQMNAAIKVETDRAEAAEKALGERIDAFNLPEGGFASKSEFDTLKGKVEDEDGALARANAAYELAGQKTTTTEVKTQIEAYGYAVADNVYDKETIDGKLAPLATTEALNAVDEKADKGIADAAKALTDAKAYTDEVKAGILGEGITETFDTLKEIEDWINNQGGSTVELTKAIADEAKAREEADKGHDEKLAALEAKPGLDKVGTVTSITAGTGLTGGTITETGTIALNETTIASLNKADTAVQPGDIGTMAKETANDYVKKTDATYTDILTKTEAATAYQPAGDYATGAQGDLADTALQEITTTANNGLKVTGKNQIDIDDTVVFVFDCGSATKNITE